MATKSLFIPHPAAPTTWDRDTNQRVADRVARHTTGEDATPLRLLVLRSKIDGPASKLALLLGTDATTAAADLQAAYQRLRDDAGFNRLFHLIRGSL
jgi:hypothetical protein